MPFHETCEHRDEIIALMHPHDTEMDLSIANALYFAARGRGLAITAENTEPSKYATTARVLLSGLGADELFGGYSRHGAAFTRGGYPELIEELKLDVSRLGRRNLGRDDRVMSHWGREVRFPFLDERLVEWAIKAPVWEKCDFHCPASANSLDAEKRVLRVLASSMGMISVSKEKKRAVGATFQEWPFVEPSTDSVSHHRFSLVPARQRCRAAKSRGRLPYHDKGREGSTWSTWLKAYSCQKRAKEVSFAAMMIYRYC